MHSLIVFLLHRIVGGSNSHTILQRYQTELSDEHKFGQALPKSLHKSCFMFTGQTSVYVNMGVELFESDNEFRTTVIRCSDTLHLTPSLLSQLYPDRENSLQVNEESLILTDAVYCQCAIVSIELALMKSLISRGIQPSVVIGHSLGEFVACVAAGLLSEESCLLLTKYRAECISKYSLSCKDSDILMAAVRGSKEDVGQTIEALCSEGLIFSGNIAIAAINGPTSIVLSGCKHAIQLICDKLGKPYKVLNTTHAFHSPYMQEASIAFQEIAREFYSSGNKISDSSLPRIYSTLHGFCIDVLSPTHWVQHMMCPVLFFTALKALVESESIDTFIEVGPNATLTQLGPHCLRDNVDERKIGGENWLYCLSRGTSSVLTLNSVSQFHRSIKKSPKYLPWRVSPLSETQICVEPSISVVSTSTITDRMILNLIVELIPSVDEAEIRNDVSLIKLGLDSLHAFELRRRLMDVSKLADIPVEIVLNNPTINSIVSFMNEAVRANQELNFSTYRDEFCRDSNCIKMFPVTVMQKGIIFKSLQNSSLYVEKFKWITKEQHPVSFNVDCFCDAFMDLICRHESLRCSFDLKNLESIMQCVWQKDSAVFDRENWCQKITECENFDSILYAKETFYLGQPPLFRLKIAENGSYCAIYLFIHHLLIDGWSMNILIQEISNLYESRCEKKISAFLKPSCPFSLYAIEEQNYTKLFKSLDHNFWLKCVEKIKLSPIQTSQYLSLSDSNNCRLQRSLSKFDSTQLIDFCRRLEVSVSCILHAVWSLIYIQTFIGGGSGSEIKSIMYGYTSSGRSMGTSESQTAFGPTVNTLPMIVNIPSASVSIFDFFNQINSTLIRNVEHERFPLSDIIRLASGSLGSYSIFQVIFDFQYIKWSTNLSPTVKLEFQDFTDLIGYPLSFRIFCHPDDSFSVNITSECQLNAENLENIYHSFEICLRTLLKMTDNDLKHISWESLIRKGEHVFSISEIPTLEIISDLKSKQISDIDLSENSFSEGSKDFFVLQDTMYLVLKDSWISVLGISLERVDFDSNFFSLGGNSLLSMQVISRCRKCGVDLKLTDIFMFPVMKDLCKHMTLNHKLLGPVVIGTHGGKDNSYDSPFHIDDIDCVEFERLYEYPLIGINKAHFVGLHTSGYANVRIVPQIYFDWQIKGPDGDLKLLNVEIFNLSLNLFIERHTVFQSFCGEEGTMQIQRERPYYTIQQFNTSIQAADQHLSSTRNNMIESNLDPHRWPLFEICVTHISESFSVLHVRVSLFLMDAISDLIFRQEVSDMYTAGLNCGSTDLSCIKETMLSAIPVAPKLQFNYYSCVHEDYLYSSELYRESWQFWENRLPTFPVSFNELPSLPPAHPDYNPNGQFLNTSRWLSIVEWERLKANCYMHGITVPVALLTVYALTISRWYGSNHFLVNVLQCLRHQVHEDANRLKF